MEAGASAAKERDALYYPYIHIRDVGWLKSALLCFPQVRRMVPAGFALRDSQEIQEFCKTHGPHGPLLRQEVIEPRDEDGETAVVAARIRLRKSLEADEAILRERFGRDVAEREGAPDAFQIYRGKLGGLFEFLRYSDLAWQSDRRADPEEWLCVHPKLGDAIMSTIAIAIARSKGLEIVTGSATLHNAIMGLDEEKIYNALVGRTNAPAVPSAADQIDELAQLVIATTFDVRHLTAQKIAEIHNSGAGLRRFKQRLGEVISVLPDIPDPRERDARLKMKAAEVVDEWKEYERSLKWEGLKAVMDAREIKLLEVGGLLGMSLISIWGSVGLAIGLAAYDGYKIWRKFRQKEQNPLRFLSTIKSGGAILASELRRAAAVC